MLIFKSKKKLRVVITLILIALYSMNNVFLSIILGNLITSATIGSMSLFLKYSLSGMIGFVFFALLGLWVVSAKTKLIYDLNTSIKEAFIQKIIYHSDSNEDYSNQLSLMTNDLKQLETKGIDAEFTMIGLICSFIFALMTMFYYHSGIALAFLGGSLIPLFISKAFERKIGHASKEWIQSNSSYINQLKDYFMGIETIRTYQVEEDIVNKSTDVANKMESALRKMNFTVEAVNQLIYMGVMLFGLLLPFGVGVIFVIQYSVPLATFIAIVQLSNSLRNPSLQIMQLINGYGTIKSIKHQYLQLKNTETIQNKSSKEEFKTIEIKNLTISHKDKILFKDINLSLIQGDKILVKGKSGSGKSTLLKVIQQTFKIHQGHYWYNGQISENSSIEIFSLIRQQPLIFNDSILYNITLGESYSESELNEAIEIAQLKEVIAYKGLEYNVGERGENLSTGELQRIEIARAMIRKRPIILADEMTSALDERTADKIRQSILKASTTLIEVAHDLSDDDYLMYTKVWNTDDF